MQRRAISIICFLFVLLGATLAAAEPFEPRLFKTPPPEPGKEAKLAFKVEPEYRVRMTHVHPLELNGTVARNLGWGEQRLRLDITMAYEGVGAVFVQADILDGVLFGDNGEFGKAPTTSSGMGITAKQPNVSSWAVGLLPQYADDPLSLSSYGPLLRPAETLRINFAYGEVMTPVGVIRIGRQPLSDRATVSLNDGRTGRNRWGASWYHHAVDRVLFGTKVSEAFKMLAEGPGYKVDRRTDDGVFMGIVYDYLVEDDVHLGADDHDGLSFQLIWLEGEQKVAGWDFKSELVFTVTHRWDERYNTGIFAFPFQGIVHFGPFRLKVDFTALTGSTQELSAGFASLTGDEVTDQTIAAYGARAVLDAKVGDFTFVAEWAFATGDEDPRPSTPMNTFSWPRDTNLGLLLFEHTLAFQSARSAAVGIENLKQIDAESFPLTELSTEGRATNINAIFPQVFWEPVDDLVFKVGALFAFSQANTVDAIQTILAFDGVEIEDDALNYHGGRPGSYWGTEIDLGIEWRYRNFFEAVIEGAYLFPGEGLRDENGDAVNSWMVESRFTFRL